MLCVVPAAPGVTSKKLEFRDNEPSIRYKPTHGSGLRVNTRIDGGLGRVATVMAWSQKHVVAGLAVVFVVAMIVVQFKATPEVVGPPHAPASDSASLSDSLRGTGVGTKSQGPPSDSMAPTKPFNAPTKPLSTEGAQQFNLVAVPDSFRVDKVGGRGGCMVTISRVTPPARDVCFVQDKCDGAPWAIKMQTAIAQVEASTQASGGRAWSCNTHDPKVGIVVLTTSREEDIANLLNAVHSLKNFIGEDDPAPLIVFHEDLSASQQLAIREAAAASHATLPRSVSFHAIQYEEFPPGFNPDVEEPNWQKRTKWGYHHMIRWWAYRVWHHPAVRDLELTMRLDTDACYKGPLEYPMKRMLTDCSKVYRPYGVQCDIKPVQYRFHEFYHKTIDCMGIQAANPGMLAYEEERAPADAQALFNDHFEVVRVSFMRRPDVMAFVERVTEYEPYGVFRWRWGDHIVRYSLLALFAPSGSLDLTPLQHYHHPCEVPTDSILTELSFEEMAKRGW